MIFPKKQVIKVKTTSSHCPKKAFNLRPKNLKQQHYVETLKNIDPPIVIATGASGSGKTLFASYIGAQKLIDGQVERIVVTRPTVSVGTDNLGFLPGTLDQKLEPWVRPVFDALGLHFDKQKITQLMKDGILEVASLPHLRGRTFTNSWIICDEAQNTTAEQMLMVLTRIGEGSKLVVTGDPSQHDRSINDNGLCDLLYRINNTRSKCDFVSKAIEVIEFDYRDVQRHPVIPIIIEMYSDVND